MSRRRREPTKILTAGNCNITKTTIQPLRLGGFLFYIMAKAKQNISSDEVLTAIDDVVGFVRKHINDLKNKGEKEKAFRICEYYFQGLLEDFAVKKTIKHK